MGSSPGAAAASVSPDVDVDGDDERRRRSNGVVVDGDGSDTSRSTSVPAAEDIKRLAALVRWTARELMTRRSCFVEVQLAAGAVHAQ